MAGKAIELRGAREAQKALKEIAEGIDAVSEEVLKKIGQEALDLVRARTPVRTGRLRRGHRMKMLSEKSLLLFNEVSYAHFVEYGHSGIEPQPHWRPAMEIVKKRFPELYARNAKQLADRLLLLQDSKSSKCCGLESLIAATVSWQFPAAG